MYELGIQGMLSFMSLSIIFFNVITVFLGLRNRQTGSNSINDNSSRSHSMLTLDIESEMQDPDDENLYITKHGKLTFVDLAGKFR